MDSLSLAARRLAAARHITVASAVDVLRGHPEVLKQITAEVAALTPGQLAELEAAGIDSPSVSRPTAATTGAVEAVSVSPPVEPPAAPAAAVEGDR